MGTFLRDATTEKRVRVSLPSPPPADCVYDIVVNNGPNLRITVGGQDALVMAPDGSVAINLALLSAKVEEAPSRWAGFDPKELETMRRSVTGQHRARTKLPSAIKDDGEIERLDRLWAELYEEINARQGIEPPAAELTGYQGPGRYRNHIDGEETNVLGLARVGGLADHYVVCTESDNDGDGIQFFMERLDVFNGTTSDGPPAYVYLGPAEEEG
jgi:hypothetical protein